MRARRFSFVVGVVTFLSALPAWAQDNTTNNTNGSTVSPNGSNTSSPSNDSACDGDTNPCRSSCSSSSCCNSCRHGRCSSCSGSSSCSCRKPSLSLSLTGIRGSLTRVSTAGGTNDALGLAFAGGVDTYALDGTTHGSLHWVLGGGDAGFEGKLAGELDFGYRLDVSEHTGPFGRAGFDGRMQGNDKLYFSTLELPKVQLGWQYLAGKSLVEAGVRGGPILSGRYNPGDNGYRRLSGSIEYGAFATMQFDFLRVEGTAMRIDARNTGNGRPVDVGRASICGVTGKVGICGDVMFLRGEADMGPNAGGVQTAMSTYAGLSVGVASW